MPVQRPKPKRFTLAPIRRNENTPSALIGTIRRAYDHMKGREAREFRDI